MPAPITVVIPTLNSAATLGPTLGRIYLGIGSGHVHQVIFADGGSTDDTLEIAKELGGEVVTTPAGRGLQLAAAMAQVQTPWAFVIHSDTILAENWPEIAGKHIQNSKRAAYGRLSFDSSGVLPKITACWANLRARLFGLPYGDQGLLIPITLYKKIGGYPEIPIMEDVAIALKLRHNLKALPVDAMTSGARYEENGWLRQGAKNLILLTRFLLGAKPELLAKKYPN